MTPWYDNCWIKVSGSSVQAIEQKLMRYIERVGWSIVVAIIVVIALYYR